MDTPDEREPAAGRWGARTLTVLRVLAVPSVAAVMIVSLWGDGTPPTADTAPTYLVADVPLPADCVPNPKPPPTEYGFVARVKGGTMTGPSISVTGMDISICGVIRLVNATPGTGCEGVQARTLIPADGVVVNKLKSQLTVIPGKPLDLPVKVKASPMQSDLKCTDSDDGITLELEVKVKGGAGAFGLTCIVPFSGKTRGVVTGPLLSPPYEGSVTITGTLNGGGVTNNDAFCPGDLPERVERITGLPSGGYKVKWPAKISVYHP